MCIDKPEKEAVLPLQILSVEDDPGEHRYQPCSAQCPCECSYEYQHDYLVFGCGINGKE